MNGNSGTIEPMKVKAFRNLMDQARLKPGLKAHFNEGDIVDLKGFCFRIVGLKEKALRLKQITREKANEIQSQGRGGILP